MIVNFTCPYHNDAKKGTCPLSFIAFNQMDGMKVYFQVLEKVRLEKGVVSFLKEVDTRKELSSKILLSCLKMSLTQDKELCSYLPI